MPSALTCRAEQESLSLRATRQQLGLSQVALAIRLGVSQPHIAQLEAQADMHLSTLQRYVAALGGELAVVARFAQHEQEIALPDGQLEASIQAFKQS